MYAEEGREEVWMMGEEQVEQARDVGWREARWGAESGGLVG